MSFPTVDSSSTFHYFSPTLYNKYGVYGINPTFGISLFFIHKKFINAFNDNGPLFLIFNNIFFQSFSSI